MAEENFGGCREDGFRRSGFLPKPVKIGQEHEVDIKETSQRGEGIDRIESLVVFVRKPKAGDNVRIRITP